MPSRDWARHAAPHVKKAMKKAMADARRTWRGAKQPTKAEEQRIRALQKQREDINHKIRKMKGK